MIAQVSPESVVQGFGLQAGIIIVAEALVIIYLYRKLDALQERRYQEAKEVQDRLVGPLDALTKLTKKIHDVLNKNRGA